MIKNNKQILNFPIENRDPDHLKYSKKGKIGAKFQIPNSKSGFTLLEVLLALSVLLIGVLAVIQLFPTGLSMVRLSKNETIATNLVQDKLEEIQGTAYNDINPETRTKVSNESTSPFYNFKREISVQFVDSNLDISGADLGLKKIVVTIFWQEKGEEKSVSGTYLKHQ